MFMYANITVGGFLGGVALQVNEILASSMFNDNFWINQVNNGLSFIYGYHKWSWNIQNETLNQDNNYTTSYNIQEIISVTDSTGNQYVQVQYYPKNYNEFKIDGNKLVFYSNPTSDINIIYRRWNIIYTTQDLGKQLDIPPFLNSVLEDLVLFRTLPIWLGEGSGQMMNNYLQDAIQQLERYRQIDSYAEVERSLTPNRR